MTAPHTRVAAQFFTFPGNGIDRFVGDDDPDLRIISADTNKTMGPSSGSFTIKMKRSHSAPIAEDLWTDPEGVWVGLHFVINGEVFDTMFGLIDSVRITDQTNQDGARDETIVVSGRDFGKVFEETKLYVNIYERDGVIPTIPMYDALQEYVLGKPNEIVAEFIRAWVGNNGVADTQWQLPPSLGNKQFYELLNKSTISRKTRGRILDQTILNPDFGQRSLWQALQQFGNLALNEMWVDLGPDPTRSRDISRDPVSGNAIDLNAVRNLIPCFYLRERPFPTRAFDLHRKSWNSVATHNVFVEDIKTRNVTKGGQQYRYNFWVLEPQGLQAKGLNMPAYIQQETGDGKPGSFPIYDLDSIRKHGLRFFSQSTTFIPTVESGDEENPEEAAAFIKEAADWLQMLHDWYVVGPKQLTGTLTLARAMPWIRIGQRVREQTRHGHLVTYYIEGVSHTYRYGGAGSTTLTVTRGEPDDRDLLEEQYEGIDRADQIPSVQLGHITPVEVQNPAKIETIEAVTEPIENPGDSQNADPKMNFDNVK